MLITCPTFLILNVGSNLNKTHMKYILGGVILIIIFQIWWRNNWRRPFGKGLTKIDKKDYKSALTEFGKALKKNQKNWQIDFYQGVCFKHLANNPNFSESTKLSNKKNSIFALLWATEKNPNQNQSSELIKSIIENEKNDSSKKILVDYLKQEIGKMQNSAFTTSNIEKQFKWIESY